MMTKGIRYTEEFKRDAIFQVTDLGNSVKEVSGRLSISTKSLYDWIKLYKNPKSVRLKETDQVRENRRLKAELVRVTEGFEEFYLFVLHWCRPMAVLGSDCSGKRCLHRFF